MKYLMAVCYVFFTTSGITFMKLGGDSLKLNLSEGFNLSMGWKTFIGFLLYIVSFLLWQRLLVKYDLSMLVPIITGIVQIIVLLIGHFIFKESIGVISLIGVLLIIIGIVLMAFGNR